MDKSSKQPLFPTPPVQMIRPSVSTPPAPGSFYLSNPPNGFDSQDDAESEGGLLEYLRILWRRKKPILLAAFAGLILGFGIGIPFLPVYRAHTSLEVLSLNEDFMNMKQSNPVSAGGGSSEISEEQTQAKLLESEALTQRVFDKLDPGVSHLSVKPRLATSGWRGWLHKSEPVPVTPRLALLHSAAASLKIRTTPHTRVLDVTVDSTDPQLAANFANTLVQEFTVQTLEARWASTHKTSEWLGREIEDARVKLRAAEDALQAYAQQSGIIFTDENTNVVTEKLQQVQQELSAATADRIVKQSRYELAKDSPPESLADVLNDAGLRDTGAKLNDLRRQIADLTSVFNSDYSKVKRLQAELISLQSASDRDRADILMRIGTDYQQAVRREKLLAAAYDRQSHAVTGQGEKEIQYNILKREADSSRQLYDTMLQQTKQASLASAMRSSNVRVVDPAQLPEKPVFPNFPLNTVLGFFAGFSFSIVIVLIRHHLDRSLRQPGDVRQWTDLPELGTIPGYLIDRKTTQPANKASKVNLSLFPPGRIGTVELATLQEEPSMVAEAFRCALTSILFVGENGARPQVLVFTSANPSDGKTTAVSNLAIATAGIGRRVLVIDADMRRPRLHEIFELSNDRGLSDLLRGDFSEENLHGLIHETKVSGVHVVTAGPFTQAAGHLLYSPNFALLLSACKKDYDMVLIDTPPMLQMSDARIAGRVADAVVLVARAGQTSRDALNAANARFAEDRIPVLGTILNDWDPNRSQQNSYYKYYRGSADAKASVGAL
jgi:succinoglycan biosynthesis transport protein ExoP